MSEKINNNEIIILSQNSKNQNQNQNQNQPQTVMVGVAVPVANNQNQIIFKSTPVFVICPNCGYNGLTRTETTCSIVNCLCCFFTDPICWCCFQLCRGKDLNCNDAVHYCPRCHVVLGNYSAC